MNIKRLYFILFLVFLGCSSGEQETIAINCGEVPEGFIQTEIINNPNYVFINDPNYKSIILSDTDGNVVLVSSYEECQHYVKGGWINTSIVQEEELNSYNVLLVFVGGIFFLAIFYFNFIDLKKRNINFKNLLNYFPLLFFTVPALNILNKILDRGFYFTVYSESQSIKYISLFLSMIFLFLVARLINKSLNLNSFSLSISYFLTSFFLFDIIFLPITKLTSFSNIFILVQILWFVLFLVKKIPFRDIALGITSYSVLIFFNNRYFLTLSDLTTYKFKSPDVEVQWLPLAERVFNNNLFYSLENNVIDGYGMMLSYTQAVIHKMNYLNTEFSFMPSNANLVLLMSIFLFLDLKISNFNKLLLSSSFLMIVLDDGWLRFLLGDSLMLEGLVSFLFASFILNISKFCFGKKMNFDKTIFILFFSTLTFSKQFIETITLLMIVMIILFSTKKLFSLIGLGLVAIVNIYNQIFFGSTKSVEYIDKNLYEIVLDVVLIREAKWSNLLLIYENLIKYKFILAALLFLSFFFIINSINSPPIERTRKIIFYSIMLNFLLVLVLYIFIWQNTETESSFRYIMNTAHLIFISLFIESESFQKRSNLTRRNNF